MKWGLEWINVTSWWAKNDRPGGERWIGGHSGSSVGGTPRKEHEMSENTESAVLAGGCFWIMQQLLRNRDGVISTRVGWIDGENENPTLEKNVGHAEAVEVTFDPERLSYRELLEYFFMVHRADLREDVVGTGYRSEIFYVSEEQRAVAEETIRDVDASGHWPGKVVTRISKAGRFWAEPPESQDYLHRFPVGCPAPFPRRREPAAAS
jgi:peptide-methionine (S)-S-oxide reductase